MRDYLAEVASNKEIAKNIYEMTLKNTDGDFERIHCGQFLHLEIPGLLLRRPFGIYKFGGNSISLAYAVLGKGTKEMTGLKNGEKLKVTLPLGNGFRLNDKQKKIVLLGGGMGCVPLAYIPETYPDRDYYAFLGFSDRSRVAFVDEFERRCDTVVCTDDGSFGCKGFPIQELEKRLSDIGPDVILTCGPHPMLKSAQVFAAKHCIPTYASMEERMGCGVGACLVCACRTKQKDGTVASRRVCADGPVFNMEELQL